MNTLLLYFGVGWALTDLTSPDPELQAPRLRRTSEVSCALRIRNLGIRKQTPALFGKLQSQQVLNPTPLNPTPAICHKRKRKLRCNFRNAALQKLHCNIRFSAARKSFLPKVALQQTKDCTATSKSCVAGKWRFPAAFLRVSSPHV